MTQKNLKQKIKNLSNSSAFFYLVTEMMVKAVPFLAIPLLARMLSKEEMGFYFLFVSVGAIFSKLFGFAFPFSVTSFYIRYPKQVHSYMLNILLLSVLIFAGVNSLVRFYNIPLINPEYDSVVLWVSFCLAITEIFLAYLVISRQYSLHNILYLIKFALPFILTILIVYFYQRKSVWFAYCQGATALGLSIYMIYFIVKKARLKLSGKLLKFGVLVSTPLLPATISAYLLNAADRYMINIFYSETEVADYSFAYTIAGIFTTFVLATDRAWKPFMLEKLKLKKQNDIRNKFIKYSLFMAGIALFIWLMRTPAILILAGENYLRSAELIAPILIGNYFYFLYTVTSNVSFYHKKMMLYAAPAVFAAVLNIVLNYYMLPVYGYRVAAYTTLVSFLAEFLIAHAVSRYMFGYRLFTPSQTTTK